MDKLPPFTRPGAFAACELLLDLFFITTNYYRLDLEAIWILMVVNQETMRPFILDTELGKSHIDAPVVPEGIRGSISRRMVAEKTGLARETVRRRIIELTEKGLVLVDEKGNVRISPSLASEALQSAIVDIYNAVGRYQDRIASFGVRPD